MDNQPTSQWIARIFNSPLGWLLGTYKYLGNTSGDWQWTKEMLRISGDGTLKQNFPAFYQILGETCLQSESTEVPRDLTTDQKAIFIYSKHSKDIKSAMEKIDALQDTLSPDDWANYMNAFQVALPN